MTVLRRISHRLLAGAGLVEVHLWGDGYGLVVRELRQTTSPLCDLPEDDAGAHVDLDEASVLIARACADGFAIWSCGTVGGPEETDLDVAVYADQGCVRCGHAPCPCCGFWCDILDCTCYEDYDDCHCAYEAEPTFFTADGREWRP